MQILASIVYAVVLVNLLGFVLTICGVDVGWPFLLRTDAIGRNDDELDLK
jgi:hypothetical protein